MPTNRATQTPVVVVDDDEAIRSVLFDVLNDAGHPVYLAANGADALKVIVCLSACSPGRLPLVLLDLWMPVTDGWEVAAALKARSLRVPIIVITAASNPEACADQIGAAGVLAKPFDLVQLDAEIERVLAVHTASSITRHP